MLYCIISTDNRIISCYIYGGPQVATLLQTSSHHTDVTNCDAVVVWMRCNNITTTPQPHRIYTTSTSQPHHNLCLVISLWCELVWTRVVICGPPATVYVKCHKCFDGKYGDFIATDMLVCIYSIIIFLCLTSTMRTR